MTDQSYSYTNVLAHNQLTGEANTAIDVVVESLDLCLTFTLNNKHKANNYCFVVVIKKDKNFLLKLPKISF